MFNSDRMITKKMSYGKGKSWARLYHIGLVTIVCPEARHWQAARVENGGWLDRSRL